MSALILGVFIFAVVWTIALIILPFAVISTAKSAGRIDEKLVRIIQLSEDIRKLLAPPATATPTTPAPDSRLAALNAAYRQRVEGNDRW